MLKGGVLPAGGRLVAADIPAPAGPGGGGPAAFAQPPYPRCKRSLTEEQRAQGKASCGTLQVSRLCQRKMSHQYKLMTVFINKTSSGSVAHAGRDSCLHQICE